MSDHDIPKNQTEDVLQRTEHVPADASTVLDENGNQKPRVPFTSDLILTREQEDRLVDHAIHRIEQLETETGRQFVHQEGWWQDAENVISGSETWMGKREKWELMFHNDVSWRPFSLGGIFSESNLTVPLSRRIARQMIARANNYFFGTDPWFSADAEHGNDDYEFAEAIDEYTKYKLRESRSRAYKEQAVELAFIRGECVVKTTYRKDVEYYEVTTNILVNVSGEPIFDSTGGYIFENDAWVTRVLVDEQTGEEEPDDTIVLKRDPMTVRPDTFLWDNRSIRQSVTHFSGADSRPVYYKDFLCPLTAPSIDEADIIVHLYDMPLMDLAEAYRERGVISTPEEDSIKDELEWESTLRGVNLLRELSVNDGSPKSAEKMRPNDDDSQMVDQDDDSIVGIAECNLFFDANNDGIREHIMLVIDKATKMPIYYDYMANITPDGRRQFKVIRSSAVSGRWYGVGAMEMFAPTQEIVDLLVNRWNFSQSKAGRVTFWNPSGTLEGDRNPDLRLNDGATYTKKPGFKTEDILDYVSLPDVKHEAIKDMFEFFLQMAMNESGVQHANDANMAGLDQAKLATGIRNIEKSGMEMFGAFISCLEPCIQDVLNDEVNMIFANLDEEEVFSYFRGDKQRIIASISPDQVKDLRVRVSVLLTRYKGEQVTQQATAAKGAVVEFYGLPPEIQARTAPFYRMFLNALDMPIDADEVIQPLSIPLPPGGDHIDPNQAGRAASPARDNVPTPLL